MPFYYNMGEGPLYYLLFFAALIFSLLAQWSVSSTFKKFSNVMNSRQITGSEAARLVLQNNGVPGVSIESVRGNLSDHYDPRSNVIRLSDSVYGRATVASVGVAAHEAGHACQHYHSYVPIKLRNLVLPVANIGQALAMPLVFIGIALRMFNLVDIGVILFSAVLAFQVITLPVEFNASNRAVRALENAGILSSEELKGARRVLTAAGMTYVAATAMAAVQLLRFIMIASSRRDDR